MTLVPVATDELAGLKQKLDRQGALWFPMVPCVVVGSAATAGAALRRTMATAVAEARTARRGCTCISALSLPERAPTRCRHLSLRASGLPGLASPTAVRPRPTGAPGWSNARWHGPNGPQRGDPGNRRLGGPS